MSFYCVRNYRKRVVWNLVFAQTAISCSSAVYTAATLPPLYTQLFFDHYLHAVASMVDTLYLQSYVLYAERWNIWKNAVKVFQFAQTNSSSVKYDSWELFFRIIIADSILMIVFCRAFVIVYIWWLFKATCMNTDFC